jgi:hypothetical protein
MIRIESIIAAVILVAAFAFDAASGDAGPARNGIEAPVAQDVLVSHIALEHGGNLNSAVK